MKYLCLTSNETFNFKVLINKINTTLLKYYCTPTPTRKRIVILSRTVFDWLWRTNTPAEIGDFPLFSQQRRSFILSTFNSPQRKSAIAALSSPTPKSVEEDNFLHSHVFLVYPLLAQKSFKWMLLGMR